MNRLIIIGNGFDIAHGLKTKYSDFLKYYWSRVKLSFNDNLIQFESSYTTGVCYSMKEINEMVKHINRHQNAVHFKIKNGFFRQLNEKSNETNWVDIEMFYYNKLIYLFNSSQFGEIKKLNDEFNDVKEEFELYIASLVNSHENLSEHYLEDMSIIFNPILKKQKYNDDFLHKLTYKVRDIAEKAMESSQESGFDLYSNIHVLTFNYTNTVECYEKILEKSDGFQINNIHGVAGKNIIFGFGDERDKAFSELEGKNVNEYLRFMKSSFYLQDSRYFDMLNFIESEEYIVEIYGHSCGLSDRTLLKTIFEHKNCLQVFLSYYKQDGQDNFFDLSLNISRHFDDKQMLRRKVANKEFCVELLKESKTAVYNRGFSQ